MKLKTYSSFLFLVIFIILYPFVFYFSDQQISQKNKSEVRYFYDVWGYLNINNIDEIISISHNDIKEIDKKYFDNNSIITMQPNAKYRASAKVPIKDQDYLDVDRRSLIHLDTNYEFFITLNKRVLFFYNLKYLNDFLKDEISSLKYDKSNFANECKAISQTFKYFHSINYSTSQFKFTIDQNLTSDDELKDNEKIFKLFTNCFEYKVKALTNILNLHIEKYFTLNENVFKDELNQFISNNANLFDNQKTIEKFQDDILKIYIKLGNYFKQIGKNNLKFNYTKSDIEIKEHFQKNINTYVLSLILTFMIALISFYLLFFLRKRFIFLNKIF